MPRMYRGGIEYKILPKSKKTLEVEKIIANKPLLDLSGEELSELYRLGYNLIIEKRFYRLIKTEQTL